MRGLGIVVYAVIFAGAALVAAFAPWPLDDRCSPPISFADAPICAASEVP